MNMILRIFSTGLIIMLTLSCKEKEPEAPPAPLQYEGVDTSSNDVIHMVDFNNDYHNLEETIKGYKGKVVYMDIWASWCQCKAMMPASHKLQEKFKNEEVVFLYVSIDRNAQAWEKSAQQFNLMENSFLAKNYPKGKLFQTNNVSTIPRYMLFDKNGRLVDSNAQRPTSPLLEENIKSFLKV